MTSSQVTVFGDLSDDELKARSLLMWRNWIETGDVNLCADDLERQGRGNKAKKLSKEQMAFCERLTKVAYSKP